MLQTVFARVNGIVVTTESTYSRSTAVVRKNAKGLIKRRNEVFAETITTTKSSVLAFEAMEAYSIRVCEAVLNERLAQAVDVLLAFCPNFREAAYDEYADDGGETSDDIAREGAFVDPKACKGQHTPVTFTDADDGLSHMECADCGTILTSQRWPDPAKPIKGKGKGRK